MKIVFMGTPDFAVPSLKVLANNGYMIAAVVTQPDRPAGRKQSRMKAPAVKEAAIELGIENILQPDNIRTSEFLDKIQRLEPDLIVTAAYGKILPKSLLDLPRLGAINVHASLLPKYRGASPVQWALINGDTVTGVTVIYMDEGMDTGDILLQKEIEITPNMNCQELYEQLKELGAETLHETIKGMEAGEIKRVPQDDSKAVYVPLMRKEMGLVDWERSAVDIHNLVRGTCPWPGAYTCYKGERLKIWKTSVTETEEDGQQVRDTGEGMEKPFQYPVQSVQEEKQKLFIQPVQGAAEDTIMKIQGEPTMKIKPGTILRIYKNTMIVATGDGELGISELQFESCRKMGIYECGHNMNEGEILG